MQAASTTSAATIQKRLASVQRSKSKRTGVKKATRVACITAKTREAFCTGKAKDVGSNRHRKSQKQQQQQKPEMTSRARHCAWRLSIVILGAFCIAAGVYLLRNWIDIFTRMRGKVSHTCIYCTILASCYQVLSNRTVSNYISHCPLLPRKVPSLTTTIESSSRICQFAETLRGQLNVNPAH